MEDRDHRFKWSYVYSHWRCTIISFSHCKNLSTDLALPSERVRDDEKSSWQKFLGEFAYPKF